VALGPEKFARELRSRGISENPLAAIGEPYFPRRILSHHLAESGIHWAVSWVDAFYDRLGVTPPPLD
jgi:hypothetical protein